MTTTYTVDESEIRIITEEEAQKIMKAYDIILQCKREKWGGLFLYQSRERKHLKRPVWIAIDDTTGQNFIKEFKKKEKAIKWLTHPAGPKTVRL